MIAPCKVFRVWTASARARSRRHPLGLERVRRVRAGTKRQLHGTMRADGASPLEQVLVEGERIGAHELGVRRDLALVTVRRANEDPLGHAIGVDQRLDGSRRPAGSRFSARKGEPAANLSSGRV